MNTAGTDDTPFADRDQAGAALARALTADPVHTDAQTVVLALPRGGVPVAVPVARALGAPLDLLMVRKLGHPSRPEFAIGAIADIGGQVVTVDDRAAHRAAVSDADFEAVHRAELAELYRREKAYRRGRGASPVAGAAVIVVDDGLATGSTTAAAIAALRSHAPAKITVAVPVGAAEAVARLTQVADEVVCLRTPTPFHGVGQGYRDFSAVTDDAVRAGLDAVAAGRP